jgi:DNA primase
MINDYLQTADVRHRKPDGSYYVDCPFPECRGRSKLEVSPTKRVYYCHKCEKKGKITESFFARGTGGLLPRPDINLREDFEPARVDSSQWSYLNGVRKIPHHLIRELRPYKGPDVRRAYFPLYEPHSEEPCLFVGRLILKQTTGFISPSWWAPPEDQCLVKKSWCLWGLHRFRDQVPHVVLCEGIFDAIWEPDRLALLGKRITDKQVESILKFGPEEITILLDGFGAGDDTKAASLRIGEVLCVAGFRGPIYRINLPPGTDPDLLGRTGAPLWPERERIG